MGQVVPERDPDFRVSIWAGERAVMIEADGFTTEQVVKVLRRTADKIEQGGTSIHVGLN